MNEFTKITAYKCNKCGTVVEIPSTHMCQINDVTCAPSSYYRCNTEELW